MKRHLELLVLPLAVALVAGALVVATQVPSSAYVVPAVQIATAGDPILITPEDLGARRTDTGLEFDPGRLDAAVAQLAEAFFVPPEPGAYDLTPEGVVLRPGVPGYELDHEAAKALLLEALSAADGSGLQLPIREVAAPDAPPVAVVVNLSQFRLELYEGTGLVKEYVVGVGKLDFPTPPGVYHVASKAKNPSWRNPNSRWSRGMPAYIPPGPRNPLGTRALRLDRDAIVIHGTPNPSSVGQRSSHGCVRMRRADVEELFELVPVGAPVFIVP